MADATHSVAIRSGYNWKPPFLTHPLQCYYIEQTYTAGVLTGGTSITSDSDDDINIFLEAEYTGAAHQTTTRRTLFCFLEEGIDLASLPTKYDGSYCNWEGMVAFPLVVPADDSAYATIDLTAAAVGTPRVTSYGYWLSTAYSAALAWNNLPTMNDISHGWAAGAHAEQHWRANNLPDGDTVYFERFLYQPPTVRFKYTNSLIGTIYGFALELELVSSGGTDNGDTSKIQIGKFACTGTDHHLNTFQYPYGGWFHLYWIPTGQCV